MNASHLEVTNRFRPSRGRFLSVTWAVPRPLRAATNFTGSAHFSLPAQVLHLRIFSPPDRRIHEVVVEVSEAEDGRIIGRRAELREACGPLVHERRIEHVGRQVKEQPTEDERRAQPPAHDHTGWTPEARWAFVSARLAVLQEPDEIQIL